MLQTSVRFGINIFDNNYSIIIILFKGNVVVSYRLEIWVY